MCIYRDVRSLMAAGHGRTRTREGSPEESEPPGPVHLNGQSEIGNGCDVSLRGLGRLY